MNTRSLTSALRPALGLLSLTALAALAPAAQAQQLASSVAGYSNLSAGALYSNPAAALGQPTTLADDGFGDLYHDSLAYSAYGTDTNGNNLLVSLGNSAQGTPGSLTVKFDQAPITHGASHWYGEDFIVYSNQFFIADGYATPTTDMTALRLTDGSVYGSLPTVSVSSDGVNFVTLKSDDSLLFPENPYKWAGLSGQNPSGWDDSSLQDFSKPVNPALLASDFAGKSVADAANTLYAGSAGGTAFSLAGTAFADTGIQYVRFTGFGQIDGVSRVGDAAPPVPEQSTGVILGLALLGLGLVVRLRRTALPSA